MIEQKILDKTLEKLFGSIQFPSEPKGLYEPLRYMMSIGGKRIRPRLCLLAYSFYKTGLTEEILSPATALEVFHSFTLLHDDIMDKSPLRRGKPSVWAKWNDNTAILSGDVMCIDSFNRLAKAPAEAVPAVLDLFTRMAAQVCEGQQLDMDFEKEQTVRMDDYIKMIGLKTSALIAASAKMGALIAGAPQEDCEALYRYGYDLGLAFQIADDFLDTYGEEKVFGKPIGGDILNNKKTWLLLHALEQSSDKGRLMNLLNLPIGTKEEKVAKITFVKAEYNSLKVPSDARDEIDRLTARALGHVKGMTGWEELERFAHQLVGRVK